jgi:hypothetical protein
MGREASKRATIYFEPALHRAIRLKAAKVNRSLSAIVNDAVRWLLLEDHNDLRAFDERFGESTMSYDVLLREVKTRRKL